MKVTRFSAWVLFMAVVSMFMACGSDDEGMDPENGGMDTGNGESVEVTDVSAEDLVGHWQCVTQKWVEAGDTWQSSYDIAKDEYYIQFNKDLTGNLDSGSDQLMEISTKEEFSWSVSNGIITVGDDETDRWYIKAFSGNSLTLYWIGHSAYNITCEFKRDAGGTYKPFPGPQITRVDNYDLLKGGKKQMVRTDEFIYDSQGRIKEWKLTSFSAVTGAVYVDRTAYNYVGNTIIVDSDYYGNQTFLIGENGYFKLGDGGYVPLVDSQDVTKITYNAEGHLSTIDYGEDLLRKGTIAFTYGEDGYSSLLDSFFETETYEYIYNVEAPNTASINLIPLYIHGGYFNYEMTLFDIVGKRPPFLPREYTYRKKQYYEHEDFIILRDKEGRVSQIKGTGIWSSRMWDIYYAD